METTNDTRNTSPKALRVDQNHQVSDREFAAKKECHSCPVFTMLSARITNYEQKMKELEEEKAQFAETKAFYMKKILELETPEFRSVKVINSVHLN